MTEAEWLACDNTQAMLEFLRGKASNRKLRLFAVGCCRGIWGLLTDQRSCRAVDVAERYADNQADLTELTTVQEAAHVVFHGGMSHGVQLFADAAAASAAAPVPGAAGWWGWEEPLDPKETACWVAAVVTTRQTATVARLLGKVDESRRLIYCLFGPLLFRPVTLGPAWRTAIVTSLAAGIYTDRAFDRLPILADALEDAGCTDRDILDHCRYPGEHARGCWVVDLVLGRE